MRIILPTATTLIHCGDCDGGTFAPVTADARTWTCDKCGHTVNDRDVKANLDEHEWLGSAFIAKGEVRLAYTTRPADCMTCGTSNHLHFSVRLGDTMPATFIDCPEGD